MKALMVWKYYPAYLSFFYKKNRGVLNKSFAEHQQELFDDHFNWLPAMRNYMKRRGIETEVVVANAENLQKKWAAENDFTSYSDKGWEKEIVMERIRRFRPDILWLSSIFDYFGDFVRESSPYYKRAIAQIGSPFREKVDFSGISVLISENPDTFRSSQHLFEKVIITKHFFDRGIIDKVKPVKKEFEIIFIGGISLSHFKRAETLAYLIRNGINLRIYGYLKDQYPGRWNALKQAAGDIIRRHDFSMSADSLKQTFLKGRYKDCVEIIKSAHHGPLFGVEMYRALAASQLALNVHIDVAGGHSGNMRMFETTGIGTCLLTERSKNISELFAPGTEILTYGSKKELLEIVRQAMEMKKKVEEVARAGQERTLRHHTVERMFDDIKPAFDI